MARPRARRRHRARSGCCWSLVARDVRRRAALRRRRRVPRRSARRARRVGRARRPRRAGARARSARAASSRSEPLAVDIVRAARGRCRCPAACVEDPLLPAPAPLAVGRAAPRVTIDARFAPPRAHACSPPPRVVVRDPLGLAARGSRAARDEPDEVLVLPRIEPVRSPRRRRRRRAARRSARPPVGRGRGRARRPARAPRRARRRRGSTGRRWRAAAAAWSAGCAPRATRAPLVVLDPRARRPREEDSTRRSAPPRRWASHSPRAAAARCCCRATGARRALEPALGGWPHLHARLALRRGRRAAGAERPGLAPRPGPLRRRARALAAAAARAGPRARRRPRARRPRARSPAGAPTFTVAGCTGYDLSRRRARRAGTGGGAERRPAPARGRARAARRSAAARARDGPCVARGSVAVRRARALRRAALGGASSSRAPAATCSLSLLARRRRRRRGSRRCALDRSPRRAAALVAGVAARSRSC